MSPRGLRGELVHLLDAGATTEVPAGVTALLPRDGQAVVFHTPLLIIVLIAGTALVLWRILRSPGTGPDA